MAQLISTQLLPQQHQVKLVFMDCFGKRQEAYVTLGSGPTPQEKTESMLASMTAVEDTIKQWAAAQTPPYDLTADLAAGAVLIDAALKVGQ